MGTVNELLGETYTFEVLVKKYKPEYYQNTMYSSATVLFCSNAFSEVFNFMSEEKPEAPKAPDRKIGRNEPCPCGSGKKYKNC